MTPRQIIADARHLLDDDATDPTKRELSDRQLLSYLNHAINRVAARRPDLFAAVAGGELRVKADGPGVLNPPGNVQQLPADALRLIDVVGYTPATAGSTIQFTKETSLEVLQSTSAPAMRPENFTGPVSWIRYPKYPRLFLMVPGVAIGDKIRVIYAKSPDPAETAVVWADADDVTFPDAPHPALDKELAEPNTALHPALVYLTAAIPESRTSEQRVLQHAEMWKHWFEEDLIGEYIAREITDRDDADVELNVQQAVGNRNQQRIR